MEGKKNPTLLQKQSGLHLKRGIDKYTELFYF